MDNELLVIVNREDSIVRVFENTPEARRALAEWETHDQLYSAGEISDDDYRNLSEWMDEKGIRAFTTESRWDHHI